MMSNIEKVAVGWQVGAEAIKHRMPMRSNDDMIEAMLVVVLVMS